MLEAASIPALTLALLAAGSGGAPAHGAPSQQEVARPGQAEPAIEPSPAADEKKPAAKAKKKRPGRRRTRCSVYTPPRYRRMARGWRLVPRIPKPRYREGYRDLVLASVNLGERVRFFPFLPDGSLDPEALREVERVMRDHHTNAVHAVNPRLVKLLYRLADHFDARQITIISGYREPGDDAEGGHHGRGNAADIIVPGVSLPALARFARQLGHVGVGLYPNAGFIHLDARDRSYFWVDRSGPGSPGCPARVATETGYKWDRRWKPEDDEPVPRRDRHGVLLGHAAPSPDATPVPSPTPPPDDGEARQDL